MRETHKLTSKKSEDLALSSISNNGESGELAKQARSRAIDKRNKKKEEDSAIQAHNKIESNTTTRIEGALKEIGEDKKDIKNNGLHSVESDVAAEGGGVSDNSEVESKEEEESSEGGSAEEANSGEKRLEDELEGGELGEDVLPILNAVEEGVEVAGGRDNAVAGGALVGVAGDDGEDSPALRPPPLDGGSGGGEGGEGWTEMEAERGGGEREEEKRGRHCWSSAWGWEEDNGVYIFYRGGLFCY